MQVNVIYALKSEKWHNSNTKFEICAIKSKKIFKICIIHEFTPQKAKICKHARKKYQYSESVSPQTYICKV